MKYALVEWIDSVFWERQVSVGDETGVATIATVGHVVKDTGDKIVLAQDVNTDSGTVRSYIVIPKVHARTIVELVVK